MDLVVRPIRPNPAHKAQGTNPVRGDLVEFGDKGVFRDIFDQFDPNGPESRAFVWFYGSVELNQKEAGGGDLRGQRLGWFRNIRVRLGEDRFIPQPDWLSLAARCEVEEENCRRNEIAAPGEQTAEVHILLIFSDPILSNLFLEA